MKTLEESMAIELGYYLFSFAEAIKSDSIFQQTEGEQYALNLLPLFAANVYVNIGRAIPTELTRVIKDFIYLQTALDRFNLRFPDTESNSDRKQVYKICDKIMQKYEKRD